MPQHRAHCCQRLCACGTCCPHARVVACGRSEGVWVRSLCPFGRQQLLPRPPRPPRTTLFLMAAPSSSVWGSGPLHVLGSVPLDSLLSLNIEPRFYLLFYTFVTVSKGEAPRNGSAWSDHTGMHVVLRRAGPSAVPAPVSGALTSWPVGGARSLLWSLLLCGGSTARLVCRGALQF